jgi:transcriptional regulator with XRE-family HTH domain
MMREFGAELRRRRLAAGLSLADLARTIHYSKGYLSKLETGVIGPNASFARICDSVLQADGALMALGPSRLTTPANHLTGTAPLEELSALTWSVRPPADVAATLGAFQKIFAQCRMLGHQISPAVLLSMLIPQTQALRALAQATPDPAQAHEFWRLAARFAEYTGWMQQEAGEDAAAISWTDIAVACARSGHDDDLVAFAHVRHADLALYRGDAELIIDLTQRTQRDPGASLRTRSLAAQREAQGHALAGSYNACMRALDHARELGAANGEAHDGRALGTTSLPDPVEMTTAWALYDLGRLAEAARIMDSEVPRIPQHSTRSRVRFGIRHALAHSSAGNIEHACELAAELLADTRLVDSATIRIDLRRLVRSFARWSDHPQVREIQPLLMGALTPEQAP